MSGYWTTVLRAVHLVSLCGILAGCDLVLGLTKPDAPPDAAPTPELWRTVDGGASHSCGIRIDRSLWCWGRGDAGQLARGPTGTEVEHLVPAQVGADLDWDSISVGIETTCALKLDQSLWCWGYNEFGSVGDGTRTQRYFPVRIPGVWLAVSAGRAHTCAVDGDEGLHCWGSGIDGRLGSGATVFSPVPYPVVGGGAWKLVRAGEKSTCGIRTDGTLWCWGSNEDGRLGNGFALGSQSVPVQVGTEAWTALTLTHDFACAIRDTDVMRCWGANASGQHGDRTVVAHATPTPVADDVVSDWTSVDSGTAHVCATHGAGQLACWGSNAMGQLATDLTRPSRPIPTAVEGGPWASIGLGTRHICAIDTAGGLWCAGYAAVGALGTGDGSKHTPTAIEGSWERPTLGDDATCAFELGTQTLGCWGSNLQNLLGDGTDVPRQTPAARIPQPFTAADLGDHGCALDTASMRWCWGANQFGQLGNSTMNGATTPVKIGLETWNRISASRSHSCGITSTQQLLCWGRNAERQTGQPAPATNPNGPVLAPLPVTGMWIDIGTGVDFTCGLKTDGKPYCWGWAQQGQLGNGTDVRTHIPQAVTTTQTFVSIFVGGRHACALTAAGLAECWGWNELGQLGNGSTVDRATPGPLRGSWRVLALGEEHSCGIRLDGTLACWGRNHYGQVGDGSTVTVIDPKPVNGDTDWESVAAGSRHTCATKPSGRMLCWGGNHSGALGEGNAWRATLVAVTR